MRVRIDAAWNQQTAGGVNDANAAGHDKVCARSDVPENNWYVSTRLKLNLLMPMVGLT